MSDTTEARALAESIIRLYGKEHALGEALRLVADFEARDDATGQKKWTDVASWIAELIKTEELAKPKKT
jgi:hypothetical protein